MLYHGKPQRRKGTAPVLRKVSRVVHRPLQSNATNSIRVWMRLAGRLAELERQEMHEGLEAESVRNLRRRIRRSSPYVEGMTAAEAAEKVTELVRQDHFQKIQAWRDRLQEDNKEVFRWVRAVPSSPCLNLFDDELDQADPASDDSQGALGKLQTLWRRVWDRQGNEGMEPEEYLAEFAEAPVVGESWPAVTGGELCQAALKQKNRAGGPDGWSGTELAMWPYEIWADLAVVFRWFEQLQAFPSP